MAIITKIEKQRNKLERVNLYLEDEFFCGMQEYVCVKNGLKVGADVSKEWLQTLLVESEKEHAMNRVARILQNGLKTEKQVRDYLTGKGYDKLVANHVLAKLKEYHYVDDLFYANSYVKSTAKKYGARKMKYMLKQKGVPQKIIETVLQDFEPEQEVILKLATKSLRGKPATRENLQKVANNLAYKGFNWSEIKPVIDQLKEE